MHVDQDVTAANEFFVDVELWDRGPVGEFFDTCGRGQDQLEADAMNGEQVCHTTPQFLIFQNIEGRELGWVYALKAQDLDCRATETTLRCLGCSLHEQHHRSRCNSFVNRGTDFGG